MNKKVGNKFLSKKEGNKFLSKKAQMSYSQILILLISIIAFNFLISIPSVTAKASPWPAFNVCCEKTNKGAWCINTLEENCNKNFRITPTSCEATSF